MFRNPFSDREGGLVALKPTALANPACQLLNIPTTALQTTGEYKTMKDISHVYTRYVMNVQFEYRRPAERGHQGTSGWMRDVNFQGSRVELPEPVEPGSIVEIMLATPVGSLSLAARVAWARPDLPNAPYLHGVCFTGVTPTKRDQLRALITHGEPLPVRVSCELAATYQRKGGRFPLLAGTIQDLSDRGLCIRLPEPVGRGTELDVRTATWLGEMVADAQVVWADQARPGLPRGTSYRHGLRFLRVDPLSELPLRALLYGIR
jgi:hypothetical protein